MTNRQLQKEWQRNKFEIHHQKPKIDGPYPKEVENLRWLLIVGQVLLGKIASKPYDGWPLEMGYNGLMRIYEQGKRRLAVYF